MWDSSPPLLPAIPAQQLRAVMHFSCCMVRHPASHLSVGGTGAGDSLGGGLGPESGGAGLRQRSFENLINFDETAAHLSF